MAQEFTTRSIRFKKTLFDELIKLAAQENRSFQNMVETILLEEVRKHKPATPTGEDVGE
jgi:hypothetical protein